MGTDAGAKVGVSSRRAPVLDLLHDAGVEDRGGRGFPRCGCGWRVFDTDLRMVRVSLLLLLLLFLVTPTAHSCIERERHSIDPDLCSLVKNPVV